MQRTRSFVRPSKVDECATELTFQLLASSYVAAMKGISSYWWICNYFVYNHWGFMAGRGAVVSKTVDIGRITKPLKKIE